MAGEEVKSLNNVEVDIGQQNGIFDRDLKQIVLLEQTGQVKELHTILRDK